MARGSGTVTVRGKLTPRFWTDNIVPKISAIMAVADDELTRRRSVASDHKAIIVTRRPNPAETYTVNPNPSVVHLDGVRIKSVQPDRFVEGQSVEVEVVVSYDLTTRDNAELTLGFSQGRPNAFSSAVKVQVPAGKGDMVLRSLVVPKRTGELPFMKVHVNLLESPRRSRSSPLATDSETLEVLMIPANGK